MDRAYLLHGQVGSEFRSHQPSSQPVGALDAGPKRHEGWMVSKLAS